MKLKQLVSSLIIAGTAVVSASAVAAYPEREI